MTQKLFRMWFFSNTDVKNSFDKLLHRKQIVEKIEEDIIFPGIEKIQSASWSMLLFAGYLTIAERIGLKADGTYKLTIPNKEILYTLKKLIGAAFAQTISLSKMRNFLDALVNGNDKQVSVVLQEFVLNNMSMYDFHHNEPEKSYHLFVLGILVTFSDEYEIKSNRESGFGRYDILMAPLDETKRGIILEFKKVEDYDDLEKATDDALNQIRKKKYAKDLRAKKIDNIVSYGIAFQGKKRDG